VCACLILEGANSDGQSRYMYLINVNNVNNLTMLKMSAVVTDGQSFPFIKKKQIIGRYILFLCNHPYNSIQIDTLSYLHSIGMFIFPSKVDHLPLLLFSSTLSIILQRH